MCQGGSAGCLSRCSPGASVSKGERGGFPSLQPALGVSTNQDIGWLLLVYGRAPSGPQASRPEGPRRLNAVRHSLGPAARQATGAFGSLQRHNFKSDFVKTWGAANGMRARCRRLLCAANGVRSGIACAPRWGGSARPSRTKATYGSCAAQSAWSHGGAATRGVQTPRFKLNCNRVKLSCKRKFFSPRDLKSLGAVPIISTRWQGVLTTGSEPDRFFCFPYARHRAASNRICSKERTR